MTLLALDVASECLGQRAYRASATDHRNTLATGGLPEALHHVVPEKIGKQNHDANPCGQGCRSALMTAVTAAHMRGDPNSKLIQHCGNVAETVGTHQESVHLVIRNESYSQQY